jgi:hypothetical protein
MPNVEIYRESRLTVDDVFAIGADHVAIATGADWRRDAVARLHLHPIPTDPAMPVFTPDDLMAGPRARGGPACCSTTTTISTWARSWPNFWSARLHRSIS